VHSKQLKLLPFAMCPAFPASDYYGSSVSMTDIRVNSLAIPLMPSLVHMLDYQRIGEVAGRSLFPCLLQVDAVASAWLCSPLGPRKTPYIYARVRVSPATYPSTPFSIPPVKPCRRRRHFSPQTRVNRFVFLNLPILSLGNHLGVTAFASVPFTCGLRHPAS
jgi:hypothetical protein